MEWDYIIHVLLMSIFVHISIQYFLKNWINQLFAPFTRYFENIRLANMRKEKGCSEHEFNIAFCGQVNTGKSSMINALRGISNENDPGYAKASEFERTRVMKPYKYPPNHRFSHVVLHDCPGFGTADVQADTFFEHNNLEAFDCILLFVESAIRKEDIIFAKKAQNQGVPFKFVCSKSDQLLREYCDDNNKIDYAQKDDFIKKRLESITIEVARMGEKVIARQQIFIVSSKVMKELVNADEHERLEISPTSSYAKFKIDEEQLKRFVTVECRKEKEQ